MLNNKKKVNIIHHNLILYKLKIKSVKTVSKLLKDTMKLV